MLRFYNRVVEALFALSISVAAFAAAIFTIKLILERDYGHAVATGTFTAVLILMVIAHKRKKRQQLN